MHSLWDGAHIAPMHRRTQGQSPSPGAPMVKKQKHN